MAKVFALLPVMALVLGLASSLIILIITISLDYQSINIVGIVAGPILLPVNFLCNIDDTEFGNITCAICHQDCLFIHNTWGGYCGVDPKNASQQTCLCADTEAEAKSRGIVYDTATTCNFTNIIYDISATAFKVALQARNKALLCPVSGSSYDSTGCNTDCIGNHAERNGTCIVDTPKDTTGGTAKSLYCECVPVTSS